MSRDAYTEEDYRELEERVVRLTRANKRLSGALSIVLDTLDSENVAMLFDRVLDRITETFGADGTLVYFAASDGFHLRGATDSLSRSVIPEFMDFGRS
ncbi:MAG: histidine kinase, partial [Atopobiaceae bacterium]|nr:histidine kinase [Atopobiaceae bacterium]